MNGILAALEQEFPLPVKINCVMMKGFNDVSVACSILVNFLIFLKLSATKIMLNIVFNEYTKLVLPTNSLFSHREIRQDELIDFVEFTKDKPVDVRFIEVTSYPLIK